MSITSTVLVEMVGYAIFRIVINYKVTNGVILGSQLGLCYFVSYRNCLLTEVSSIYSANTD